MPLCQFGSGYLRLLKCNFAYRPRLRNSISKLCLGLIPVLCALHVGSFLWWGDKGPWYLPLKYPGPDGTLRPTVVSILIPLAYFPSFSLPSIFLSTLFDLNLKALNNLVVPVLGISLNCIINSNQISSLLCENTEYAIIVTISKFKISYDNNRFLTR